MVLDPAAQGSPLLVAGLFPGDEQVYRTVLRVAAASRLHLTEATGLNLRELDEVLARFAAAGLVRLRGDQVVAEPPGDVLGRLITEEADRLHREGERIDALRDVLPSLIAEFVGSERPGGGTAAVYAVDHQADIVGMIRGLAEESDGDLMWFRPDQWRLPVAGELDELVRRLISSGHRSRAVYPAKVLEEEPQVVRSRAQAGEKIRIVAAVPTRIAIFGDSTALLSDRWGVATGRRLVVREHALVGALRTLFENVWERGMAVPGMDAAVDASDGQRRLLLHQLTLGAKDEHIARTLGVSLRTVRRRVAELMDELDAESRFQAGAEAVRRGWL